MKISQKVLSVLVSILLLFSAISCANDSVDENTKPEPKPETNKPQIELPQIKDGTYPVNLVPQIDPRHFKQAFISTGKTGKGLLKPILGSKCTVSDVLLGKDKDNKEIFLNDTFFYYLFELPKEIQPQIQNTKIKGIVLAKNEITDKTVNITISNQGKNITCDWTKISYIGFNTKIETLESLQLSNSLKQSFVMVPEPITDKFLNYIGTWVNQTSELTYKQTLVINSDKTGSYDFGKTVKGTFKIDDSNIFGLDLVGDETQEVIANVLIYEGDLRVSPKVYSTDKKILQETTIFKKQSLIN